MAEKSKPSKLKELKNLVQKMNGGSYNPQQELLELLKSKCPQGFTEGKIDPKKLRQTLGEEVSEEGERYGLSWAGKADCFRHIQETTTATLKPIRSESVDFDKTENIFIEGDNLEVLKILQKTYQNKIKMIYIDPPYNTGNDSFIYPDRYKEEKDDYELRAGIKDAEGLLTKDGFWRKNSKDAGHFHSNWLSMMYPRLFLAKNLLREDGVIFVSIDDNEVQNLRMIMDEVFGEENFVSQLIWNTEGHTDNQYHIKVNHEYILLYVRSNVATDEAIGYAIDPNTRQDSNLWKGFAENSITKNGPGNPPSEILLPKGFPCKENIDVTLHPAVVSNKFYKDVEELGYVSRDITKRYSLEYPIRRTPMEIREGLLQNDCIVFSGWANANKLKQFIENNFEPITEEDGVSYFYLSQKGVIYYRKDRPKARNIVSVLRKVGTTEQMRSTLESWGIRFQYPKPFELMKYLAQFGSHSDSIILDFFAGSCTTAHAAMALNAEDGGNRKFICVQLPEPCEAESEAYRAGFKTITEIGKERIRRAAKKIKKEIEGNLKFDKNKLDLGFKIFRLEQSNFKQWRERVKTGDELKEQMRMFVDNVKKGAATEDMLFEIILKNSRFDLNVKVEKQSFDGIDYYRLADGVEIVCLAPKITKKFVDKVLSEKPERFTCLDIGFKNNDQLKTNTALQMEAGKVEFKVI